MGRKQIQSNGFAGLTVTTETTENSLDSGTRRQAALRHAIAALALLALLLSSWAPARAQFSPTYWWPRPGGSNQPGILGPNETDAGDPVEITGGTHFVSETLASVPGRMPINLSWHFRSLDPRPGPMGLGTYFSYDYVIGPVGGNSFELVVPGGGRSLFTLHSSGNYYVCNTDAPFLGAKLYKIGSGIPTPTGGFAGWASILSFPNGNRMYFDKQGFLYWIVDRFGNSLQIARTGYFINQITQQPENRSVRLQYGNNLLTTVTLPDGRFWTIKYTTLRSGPQFSDIVDPRNKTTHYDWLDFLDGLTPAPPPYNPPTTPAPPPTPPAPPANPGLPIILPIFPPAPTPGPPIRYPLVNPYPNAAQIPWPWAGWPDPIGQGIALPDSWFPFPNNLTWPPVGTGSTPIQAYWLAYPLPNPFANNTAWPGISGWPIAWPPTGSLLIYDPTVIPTGGGGAARVAPGAAASTTTSDPGFQPLPPGWVAVPVPTLPPGITSGFPSGGNLPLPAPPGTQYLPLIARIVDRSHQDRLINYYDPAGRVVEQVVGDGGIWRFQYNFNQTVVRDPLGNPTTYNYAYNGNQYGYKINQVVDSLGHATSFAYNAGGTDLPSGITDWRNRTAQLNWDTARGLLTSVTVPKPSGGTMTASAIYHPNWPVATDVTDFLGRHTIAVVDVNGLVTSVTNPRNVLTSFTYGNGGVATSVSTTVGGQTRQTNLAYYNNGDLQSVTDPAGRTYTINYEATGTGRISQVIPPIDPINSQQMPSVYFFYNEMDQLVQTKLSSWNGLQVITPLSSISYDDEGRVLSYTNRLGAHWDYQYDRMDRPIQVTNPLGQISSFKWDLNGNLLLATDAKGQKVENLYGTVDRIASSVYRRADGTVDHTETYNYDATSGLLASVVDSQRGIYSVGRDSFDRAVSESVAGVLSSWTLDDVGRTLTRTMPGNPMISYGYDANDNVTSISQGTSLTSMTYDELDRMVTRLLPNGVGTAYTFDAGGRLTNLVTSRNATVLDSRTYGYSAVGQIVSELANGQSSSYGYDSLGRLTAATTPAGLYNYTYDNAGNRTQVKFNNSPIQNSAYNLANRLTSVNGIAANHDAIGNLTSLGTESFTWNMRGELTNYAKTGSGAMTASFSYDLMGRRSNSTVNGSSRSFGYDGLDVLGSLPGMGVDDTLKMPGGMYPIRDIRGSVMAHTDGAGNLSATLGGYGPYGEGSGSNTGDRLWQWTGRENDGTGLYYLRNRYYSPGLGRFISEDPIGFGGGENFYAYCFNDPINFTDPSGLFAVQFGDHKIGSGDPFLIFGNPTMETPPLWARHSYCSDGLSDDQILHGMRGATHEGQTGTSELSRWAYDRAGRLPAQLYAAAATFISGGASMLAAETAEGISAGTTVPIYRAPGQEQLPAAIQQGRMVPSSSNPFMIHVTPNAEYAEWYANEYGTQVFVRHISPSEMETLRRNWRWGFDHSRLPGGEILQVPTNPRVGLSHLLDGWLKH